MCVTCLKSLTLLVICLLVTLPARTVRATDFTFNQTGTGSWATTTHWTPNGLPGAADVAIIPRPGTASRTMSLGGVQSIAELRIAGEDRTNTYNTGTLNTPFINATGNGSTVSANVFNININQAGAELLIFTRGSTMTVNGILSGTNIEKTGAGTLILANTANALSGTFTITGGMVIADQSTVTTADNLGSATYVLNGGELQSKLNHGGQAVWDNNIRVTATSRLDFSRSNTSGGTGKEHRFGSLTIGSTLNLTNANNHFLTFTGTTVTQDAAINVNTGAAGDVVRLGSLISAIDATLTHGGIGEMEIRNSIKIVPPGAVAFVPSGHSFVVVDSASGGTLDDTTGAAFSNNVWSKSSTPNVSITASLNPLASLGVLPLVAGAEINTGGATFGSFEFGAGSTADPLLLDLNLGAGVDVADLIAFMAAAGIAATPAPLGADPKFELALTETIVAGEYFVFDFSLFDAAFAATTSTSLNGAGFQADALAAVPEPTALALWSVLSLVAFVIIHRRPR